MKSEKWKVKDEKTGMHKQGKLFVVSGPSGVGKSTLIERFLKEDRNTSFSVSYTTRAIRKGEINGKDYHFIDRNTFLEMTEKGSFLEWESVHGNLYGTPKKEVVEILETGKDVILDIDVKGALTIKGKYPQACLIFIEPPSKDALIKRLSLRKEKDIAVRMKSVEEEIEKKRFFDYTVKNDYLEKAYAVFKGTIENIREKDNGKNNR